MKKHLTVALFIAILTGVFNSGRIFFAYWPKANSKKGRAYV